MAPRSEEEAGGRSEEVGGSKERTPEAHSGGSGSGEEERVPEASPVRHPRSYYGKDPVVAEESEEPEMPAIFVGSGIGARSPRPIVMGDFLETAIVEDLAASLQAEPGLAKALLAA